MAEREYYTHAEATALLGRRFRATHGYVDVPAGTIGKVIAIYKVGEYQYGVDVAWDLAPVRLSDGFSKEDLELVFSSGPLAGRRAMEPVQDGEGGPL